jgi:N-acetylglucosaminyl-diphospho-decaprenol L-rhamnosyltransferase
MTIPITFSVVSHGHRLYLKRLLNQLNNCGTLKHAKVIVIINIFDEPFDASCFYNLNITIIRNKIPLGFGENHNNAFKFCLTPWFAILNPDLLLYKTEPFTALLNKVFYNNPAKIGIATPQILTTDLTVADAVRNNLTLFSLILRALGFKKQIKVTYVSSKYTKFYWFAGMCLVIDSNAFKEAAGFDEKYFLYCEDYDLCARLYNLGWELLLDTESQIIHEAQKSSHYSFLYFKLHLKSILKVWSSRVFWKILLSDRLIH